MSAPSPTDVKPKKKVPTAPKPHRLVGILKALGLLGVGGIAGASLSGEEEEPYDPFGAQIQRYYGNPYG